MYSAVGKFSSSQAVAGCNLLFAGLSHRSATANALGDLPGKEGTFTPCTFWLVSWLACQGRQEQAWKYYRRALACANELGLFSEEFDTERRRMLGNFPQALTHVSQITAWLALEQPHTFTQVAAMA